MRGRTVLAYHGCDAAIAESVFRGDTKLAPSVNTWDWLGTGIYFWEQSLHRAWQFAHEQKDRNKVKKPRVVGAIIDLGRCFDLLDTQFTKNLADAYAPWRTALSKTGAAVPKNNFGPDRSLRHLDCAVINWYLGMLEQETGTKYDTVRGAFTEGGPIFAGSGIQKTTHIQVAVRNPACVVGVFHPMMMM